MGRYLDEFSPDPEAIEAAQGPTVVLKRHVAWMIETRSPSTALNKHKGLQQFFRWLVDDEEAMDRSPMARVRQPKVPKKEVPIMRDEETKALLDSCEGRSFAALRDEAIMRLYCNSLECASQEVDDIDNPFPGLLAIVLGSWRLPSRGVAGRLLVSGPGGARLRD